MRKLRRHIIVLEFLAELEGKQLEARLGIDLAEERVRLADHVDHGCDLALLHFLERDGVVEVGALDLQAEAVEDDAAGVVGRAADRVEVDLLAPQILERVDLRAHIDVQLALEHRHDVVHALLDVRDLEHVLVVIEHVRVGDREIDALEVDQVADVAHRAVGDHGDHAQVVAVVERPAEIGRISNERSLEQTARQTDGPVIDDRGALVLVLGRRLRWHG